MLLILTFVFTGNEQGNVNSFTDILGIHNNHKEFSYLNELPQKQLKEYELFANDREVSHLTEFTPEQIVLIYIHSAALGDVDSIYALTFDDGSLPEFEEFKTQYFNYLHVRDLDTALMYRYYNSIAVKEETVKQDELVVALEASIGTFTSSVVFGLKKDNNLWKMDIYHLIKHFKKVQN